MALEQMLRDIRVGVRALLRRPAFALTALATVALGVGANTAVFTVIRDVRLAPLPYQQPDRAAMVWSRWRGFDKTWVSDAEVLDYRTRIKAFSEVGACSGTQVNLTGDGDPIRIGAAFITPNLFHVLGVKPHA